MLCALIASSAALAPAEPQPQSRQYFYAHIAKTGGTSWALDIGKLPSQKLAHCGSPHIVGPGSVAELRSNVATASLGTTKCNLHNREDLLNTSLVIFSSLGLPEPRLILLLRHPVTHVRSMYAHCQQGYLRRQRELAGDFHEISFENWLALYTPANVSSHGWSHGAWRYCYYNPVDYQTAILAPPETRRSGSWNDDAARALPPRAVDSVLTLVRQAWFVGITGYYAASLCLLEARLSEGQLSPECSSGSRATTHADYGNHASSMTLSGVELSMILEITRADHVTYGAALGRLFADALDAGFGLFGHEDV